MIVWFSSTNDSYLFDVTTERKARTSHPPLSTLFFFFFFLAKNGVCQLVPLNRGLHGSWVVFHYFGVFNKVSFLDQQPFETRWDQQLMIPSVSLTNYV